MWPYRFVRVFPVAAVEVKVVFININLQCAFHLFYRKKQRSAFALRCRFCYPLIMVLCAFLSYRAKTVDAHNT
jgi:hypothetical protein